ncbi:hypothetical protein FBU30_004281 [Linnemannia zychae]|nr:hypothetical protein FBU30_004281 [Linnemannia zychae]
MDLSRLLNPLGSDSEQAPPNPSPSPEPTACDNTDNNLNHDPYPSDDTTTTFHNPQHYSHTKSPEWKYRQGSCADRQDLSHPPQSRLHPNSTDTVEQLGGLATLYIERLHYQQQPYHSQQISPRGEDYSPSLSRSSSAPGSDGYGHYYQETIRSSHYSQSPWDNHIKNSYFPDTVENRMGHDSRSQPHSQNFQQRHWQHQQPREQLQYQQEPLTSPRAKRKFLKQSSTFKPSFFDRYQLDSNEQRQLQRQQEDYDAEEGDDEENEGGRRSSGASISSTSTGGMNSNSKCENGGGDEVVSAAKRRRPLIDSFQEPADPSNRQMDHPHHRQQQQQLMISKDPAQNQHRQVQDRGIGNGGHSYNKSDGGASLNESGLQAAVTSSSSLTTTADSRREEKREKQADSVSTGSTAAVTTATATSAATTAPGTAPLTFERSGDGKIRCTFPRCGKEFSNESRLSTHIRIHSGKPPYPCDYPGCMKAFHTSSSLSHHRVVHSDQNLRPFVCRHENCGATYTQLARLITHQRTTHNATAGSDSNVATFRRGNHSSNKASSDPVTTAPLATEHNNWIGKSATDPMTETNMSANTTNSENWERNASLTSYVYSSSPSRPFMDQQEEEREDENEDLRQRREAAMTIVSFWELANNGNKSNSYRKPQSRGVERIMSLPLGTRTGPLPPPLSSSASPSLPSSPRDQTSPQDHRFVFPSQPPTYGYPFRRHSQQQTQFPR